MLSPNAVRPCELGQVLTEAALSAKPQVQAEIAFCRLRFFFLSIQSGQLVGYRHQTMALITESAIRRMAGMRGQVVQSSILPHITHERVTRATKLNFEPPDPGL